MNFLVPVLVVSLSLQYPSNCRCSQALHDAFKKAFNLTNTLEILGKRWTSSTATTWVKTTPKTTSISESIYTKESSTEITPTVTSSTTKTTLEEAFTKTTTEKLQFSTKTASSEIDISSTTKLHSVVNKTCEYNEFFFQDHCYFFYTIAYQKSELLDSSYNSLVRKQIFPNKVHEEIILLNTTVYCQRTHPRALGLAVESKEEDIYILRILKSYKPWINYIVLTSGIRTKDRYDNWNGWKSEIDKNLIDVLEDNKEGDVISMVMFYCINPAKSLWQVIKRNDLFLPNRSLVLMCERLYNPKNILLELHEKCLELYRKSSCYNLDSHVNYCCEKDEKGEIWFSCPGETYEKSYPNDLKCSWKCRSEGFFVQDRPVCTGSYICSDSYNGIGYVAPITKYAVSNCPEPYLGFSTWYCHKNQTFIEKPDYSLCCATPGKMCRDVDIFLNVWMGCPSRKVIKKSACPPGSFLEEAFVEWYCNENGTFSNQGPDYSNCNKSELFCKNKDRYGIEWVAKIGTLLSKKCPPTFTGMCTWMCQDSGQFDGPEPDCTKCRGGWMEEVSNSIKNCSSHEEVMALMENFTKKEDLRIGYGHILNLTNECVTLFKNQNSESDFGIFDGFLKSYSKIFKNLAGDPKLWLSFSVSNRKEYAEEIIETSKNAAFANFASKNVTERKYNATLAISKTDGFDFFVAYNPSIGSQFPLENFSGSNWHLNLKEVKENNSTFAAMGLVMNHSLSSLMFPQRNKTDDLELNAPAITFTVAALRNNKVVDNPNVVVSISFKHKTRTRFPETKVIKRRLHFGEQPSGVFNSTVCCYYRNSEWSTEGCFTTFKSKDQTHCTCNHLSTIALLMAIHKYEPDLTLEYISLLSSGITIASLTLALLVFYFVDAVKNDRVLIGKNLCFCLLIGHVMLITVMDKKFFNISDNLCTVYAILLHYAFMAAFAWMFVEGCHLYRMLILVFDSNIEYRWIYSTIGYGVPFVIVGVTELVGFLFQEQPYGQDELCWLKPPHYVWAFVGPVIATTSINLCILIIAMKLAISSKRRTEKFNFTNFKLWIKGWISLSTLLGITWLFGLAYIHYNETFVYTFAVFNGLQGFFIFIFRCVLCEEYKAKIQKKIKSWFLSSKSKHHKKPDNFKSETKEYAISAVKSFSSKTEGKDLPCDSRENKLEEYLERQNNLVFYPNNKERNKKNFNEIDPALNVSLIPVMSEAYLRNRMIAKNFSARKSKVI